MYTLIALPALLILAAPASMPSLPERDPASEWVERTLAELSLREKVAQMVMPWIPGGAPGGAEARRARTLVREDQVGGLLIGVGDARETAKRLNELQRASRVPLLVAADLEWGAGTRLDGTTVLPVNMALAAAGAASYAFEAGRITAEEARAAGVHVAFAPVADVNINPLNPVINTRSYGADALAVADRVAAFIHGARAGGLLAVAKHFPGHGDTEEDSHLAMPFLLASRERLESVELVPFRAAVRAGVAGVMTAHLAVPALEPDGARRPATLSGSILTDVLRNELGFQGLIVTDALNMDGVRRGRTTGDVAVDAVLAGADILLMPPSASAAIDAVVAAVEAGRIPRVRIDASVRRILYAKAEVGLHLARLTDLDELERVLAAEERRGWAEAAAERSITLVESAPDALPLPAEGRNVFVVVYDDGRRRVLGEEFDAVLEGRGAKVKRARLWRGSTAAELRAAERDARRADAVVFASYTRALPWKGELGLPEAVASFADRLADAGAAVVSFGDPYLIRQIPRARTYLLAWSDAPVAQRAAARALLGEVPISGRLPIPLPPRYAIGDGVQWPGALADAEAEADEDALPVGPVERTDPPR